MAGSGERVYHRVAQLGRVGGYGHGRGLPWLVGIGGQADRLVVREGDVLGEPGGRGLFLDWHSGSVEREDRVVRQHGAKAAGQLAASVQACQPAARAVKSGDASGPARLGVVWLGGASVQKAAHRGNRRLSARILERGNSWAEARDLGPDVADLERIEPGPGRRVHPGWSDTRRHGA